MKGSLRSWIHYIELRTANGTQKEHMEVAEECAKEIATIFPLTESHTGEKQLEYLGIQTDPNRDLLLSEAGITRLKESYMRDEEISPQERFAFVSKTFATDENHAQRLYDYSSKHWLTSRYEGNRMTSLDFNSTLVNIVPQDAGIFTTESLDYDFNISGGIGEAEPYNPGPLAT